MCPSPSKWPLNSELTIHLLFSVFFAQFILLTSFKYISLVNLKYEPLNPFFFTAYANSAPFVIMYGSVFVPVPELNFLATFPLQTVPSGTSSSSSPDVVENTFKIG